MTICRIWRAFEFEPHRADTFKLSPDPELVEKVRDIVEAQEPPIWRFIGLSTTTAPIKWRSSGNGS